MHELYELKEKLCEELEEYAGKEMSAGALDVIDKLAHAIKNIEKIVEADEYSYDDGMSHESSYRGRSYDRSYEDRRGRSYARGRNARRDSRGRYSRDDGMIEELRTLMDDAPNEKTKKEFERFIQKIEQM